MTGHDSAEVDENQVVAVVQDLHGPADQFVGHEVTLAVHGYPALFGTRAIMLDLLGNVGPARTGPQRRSTGREAADRTLLGGVVQISIRRVGGCPWLLIHQDVFRDRRWR